MLVQLASFFFFFLAEPYIFLWSSEWWQRWDLHLVLGSENLRNTPKGSFIRRCGESE